MNFRDFLKAGHTPTLLSAFLYFDISFMVWVLLGALANSIAADANFQLSHTQRGLMLAVPLLGGAILRLVLGAMTDHIGARKTGLIGLTVSVAPLLLGWLWADSFEKILVVAVMLGVAGASFAAALPLASRWYPPQHQGLAMGIAGAGNSGTALATFFAPRLAEIEGIGWHGVFGLSIIPIGLTLAFFFFFAKDSPHQPAPKSAREYIKVLGLADTWWFCIFYSVTFGGFVGLAVFLNTFFKVQFGLTPVQAGTFATVCVIAGSFLRPVGGYLADRLGGIRMLILLYVGVLVSMMSLGGYVLLIEADRVTANVYLGGTLMFLGMGFLGMGNGSVFQLVPLRFKNEIGVITGIVGAAGGVGGFFLPFGLGYFKDQTGSFAGGLLAFGVVNLVCAGMLAVVSRSWIGEFVAHGGKAVTHTPEPAAAPPVPVSEPLPQPVEA